MPPNTTTAKRMPCMEVWGSNQVTDSDVVISGLDAWVYSRPYQDADGGGDVYYVSSCATGRVTRLLVADVSGHGSSVADTALQLRRLMRRYVNHIDQGKFVQTMNRAFVHLSQEGGFATALAATFFSPTQELTLSYAGHPPPLWYHAEDRAWSLLKPGARANPGLANIPLGIEGHSQYDQRSQRLAVGDLVLFYTDSLIEAKDADGKLLGEQGLLEVVQTLTPVPPDRLIGSVTQAVAALHRGNLTDDDVTVLLIRPNGLAPSVPWKERICGPFRVLKGLVGSAIRGDALPWPEISIRSVGGAMFGPLNHVGRSRRDQTTQ